MEDRFKFNAIVTSYYDIDTPDEYKEFEPQIYLENVDVFSDEIGIDYDRLLDTVQNQLKLEKPEISQVMQHFEDNSNSCSEEYITIKPDKILQCTGLKDKNGKLIYEGDILKVENGGYPKKRYILQVVIWDRKRWQLASKRNCACTSKERQHCIHCERNPVRIEWFFQSCSPNFKDFYNSTVIGNIYENPELIKEGE